jgi:hypothetical protein
MDKGQYRDVNARPLPGFVSMVHGRVPLKVLSEAGRQMEYATTRAGVSPRPDPGYHSNRSCIARNIDIEAGCTSFKRHMGGSRRN